MVNKTLRKLNDYYPTPKPITQILLNNTSIQGNILETCAGNGDLACFFQGCATNDLYPQPNFKCDFNLDATKRDSWNKFTDFKSIDWVITNPPYNLAPEIIPLAFKYAQVGVAMLLRLSYLEPCGNRGLWLFEHAKYFSNLIVISPRPKFTNNRTDNVTSAWFVWQKDKNWDVNQIPFIFNYKII